MKLCRWTFASVWNHVPLLQFPNIRDMRMNAALAGKGAQCDAVLGWVPVPNHSGRAGLTADYHTLDHGIRRNRSDQTTLATAGVRCAPERACQPVLCRNHVH
jgi:hypothetical protein